MSSVKFIARKEDILSSIPSAAESLNLKINLINKGNSERLEFICQETDNIGMLILYFNKTGNVTANYSSGQSPEIGQKLAEYFKDNTNLTSVSLKNGSVSYKSLSEETFSKLMNFLDLLPIEKEDLEQDHTIKCLKLNGTKSGYGTLRLAYYKTQVLMLQGRNCLLFVEVVDFLEKNTDDSVNDIILRYNNLLDAKLPEVEATSVEGAREWLKSSLGETQLAKLEDREQKSVISSIYVLRGNKDLAEYSWIIFPFLRALEDAIKKFLEAKLGASLVDLESVEWQGFYFDKFGNLLPTEKEKVDDKRLEVIEDGMKDFKSFRNKYAHPGAARSAVSYGDASEQAEITLKHIKGLLT